MTLPCVGYAQIQNQFSVSDFAREYRIGLYWDVLSETGMLNKDNTIITLSVGTPVLLLNFHKQYAIDIPVLEASTLKVSAKTIVLLKKLFKDTTTKINSTDVQNKSAINSIVQGFTPQSNIKSKVSRIIIDPGHGGKDPGGIGYLSHKKKKVTVKEKDVVLSVSLLIKKYLQNFFPKLSITLTRDDDSYLSLEQRILLANKFLGELDNGELMLFISVHANAAPSTSANGYEVWYLPAEFYREDLAQNNIENGALYSIINNLRNSEIMLESFELAKLVLQSIAEGVDNTFKNRGLKENEWYVVRNAKMPAILLELGFVTNQEEGYALSKTEYQDILARHITKGIKDYVQLFDVSDIK